MNKNPSIQERRSIGQVQPGTMIDLTPGSLEYRMRSEKRDQQIQNIGRSFRGFIDLFRVNRPIGNSNDANVNRRAGITLIASSLTALALSGSLGIAEFATPDEKVCVTKSSNSNDNWTNINATADKLRDQGVFVAENTQLYDAWKNTGSNQVCMTDRQGPLAGIVDVLERSVASNS